MEELLEELKKKIANIELTERQREFASWNGNWSQGDGARRKGDYLDRKYGIECQIVNSNKIRCNRIYDEPLYLLILKMAIFSCEERGVDFDYSQAVITCQMYPKEKRKIEQWLVEKLDYYAADLVMDLAEGWVDLLEY